MKPPQDEVFNKNPVQQACDAPPDGSRTDQRDAGRSRKGAHSVLAVTAIILMAIVLYVLSAGPMYWLCSSSSNELVGLRGKAFCVIYSPVIRQYQNGPPRIRDAIRGYIDFFEK